MDEFTVDHSVRRRLRRITAAQCWALARKLVFGLTLAIACQTALAQAMYRIKVIAPANCSSSSTATGFNGADEVTGLQCGSTAFLWKNNGQPLMDLVPPGSFYSATFGLNTSGLVAGYAQDNTGLFAFEWSGGGTPLTKIVDAFGGTQIPPSGLNDRGQMTGYATTTGDAAPHAFLWNNDGLPIHDLATLGGDNSYGNAINASGQVVGGSSTSGNAATHAFVWKNDGTPMQDLGTLGGHNSIANFINASGQVVGISNVPVTTGYEKDHIFFWKNDGTPIQDLGTLLRGADAYATAFNDAGQVTGNSDTHGRNSPLNSRHGFVWLNDGTPMKDLGSLGGNGSWPNDINASGQVTGYAYLANDAGYHAFLWRNDGTKIQDLNKLVDSTDPLRPYVTVTNGELINKYGDVVAEGTDSRTGLQGLYLLQGTVLTLNPRSLSFGNQPVNTTSAAKSVTVTNTSPKAQAVTSIALSGSAAGQFAATNNCGSSLMGHAICTIKVTFKPTTKGAKSATLNVNGGGAGLRVVSLTGTGT